MYKQVLILKSKLDLIFDGAMKETNEKYLKLKLKIAQVVFFFAFCVI